MAFCAASTPRIRRFPAPTSWRVLCASTRATAAKGLNLLTEDGILYKRRGIGMFVAPRAAEKIRAKRKQAFFEQYVRPLAAEAKNLGITPAELQAMLAQASEKE